MYLYAKFFLLHWSFLNFLKRTFIILQELKPPAQIPRNFKFQISQLLKPLFVTWIESFESTKSAWSTKFFKTLLHLEKLDQIRFPLAAYL